MKKLLLSHFLASKANGRTKNPGAVKHLVIAGLIQKLMRGKRR